MSLRELRFEIGRDGYGRPVVTALHLEGEITNQDLAELDLTGLVNRVDIGERRASARLGNKEPQPDK